MDAHPVPQNVTTFEFHLIGDMTLKQFLYLAAGVGIAYLTFVLLAVPAPILAWPIIFISALLGVAFAFLPISDRPLDHWVAAFLRAVYRPTKRIWIKNSQRFDQYTTFQNRLNIYLSTRIVTEMPRLEPTQPQIPPQQFPSQLPTSDELTKTVELGQKAQEVQVKILGAERELQQIKTKLSTSPQNPADYTEEFNKTFNNLQKLLSEASKVKKELANVTNEPVEKPKPKIEVVHLPPAKLTQLVLTIFPNVINGIIKDAQGNYLEGVVVVIHNKEGLPVRALKTNKLGQFTGSTPLPNGTYTIELEKDNLMFDVLQIELTGSVLPPLNIAAKRILNS